MNVFVLSVFIATVLSQALDFNKFRQYDYQLIIERASIPHYDKRYMNYAKLTPFKCNRTNVALNRMASFKVNVGIDLVIMVQAYRFASNEYRSFPLRFQDKMCNLLKENIGGMQKLLNCGSFSGCPVVSNTNITVCNFIPDASMLPPFIPSGNYRLNLQALFSNNELFLTEVYGKVTRPEVK
ncbi:hypothetical protein ILUMI_18712 [Ignelater luminosus]|uniref:MD-2-related lipid-recognition domain-containing protein n=1 Tax=Ignelater luminosus TaxID=2038154 RepID=A0A8K0G0L8_IGNLU|nr:hypothetical protein ILUMI_18712 [Ignelater luminosus]